MSHGDLTKKNIQEAKLPLHKIYMIMKSITTIHSWKELSSLFTLEKTAILRNRLLKGSVTVTSTVLQARKRKIIRTSPLLAFPQKKKRKGKRIEDPTFWCTQKSRGWWEDGQLLCASAPASKYRLNSVLELLQCDSGRRHSTANPLLTTSSSPIRQYRNNSFLKDASLL